MRTCEIGAESVGSHATLSPWEPPTMLRLPAQDLPARVAKVGISGNLGGHTRELCAGCAAAVEEWIETSEPGYAVELVWEPDDFDEASSRGAAQRLIQAGCVAVVGHLSSSSALPAADVYHRAGIPYFAPGSSHPDLTAQGYWNVLRMYGRDEEMAHVITGHVMRSRCRSAALVWQDIEYGRTLAHLIQRSLIERGRAGAARIRWSDPPAARDLQALLASDVVLFAGTYQVGARLLRALRGAGYRGSVVMGDDAYIPDLPAITGTTGDGVWVVSAAVDWSHPDYESFRRRYEARAGREPGAYAAPSFLAMRFLLRSLDVLLEDGPAAFMSAVRADEAKHPTMMGSLRLRANGDPIAFPWATYRIEEGRFTVITRKEEAY